MCGRATAAGSIDPHWQRLFRTRWSPPHFGQPDIRTGYHGHGSDHLEGRTALLVAAGLLRGKTTAASQAFRASLISKTEKASQMYYIHFTKS